MNYKNKSFAVGAPGTPAYRDNWERTFRSGGDAGSEDNTASTTAPKVKCARCGTEFISFEVLALHEHETNHACDVPTHGHPAPLADGDADGPDGTNEA